MKLLTLITALLIGGLTYCQRSPGKIKVKVDYLHRMEDSTEVWVKRAYPNSATRKTYFVAMLPNPLPDSIKLGAFITLYLGQSSPGQGCPVAFKIMPKNAFK